MGMPLAVPRFTIADLDRFPNDGNRYELLGGLLLVTPMAGYRHQLVAARLSAVLWPYLGEYGPAVIMTPGAIQIEDHTQLEPDLLVLPASDPSVSTWRDVTAWWLAIEVSGIASRVYDRDFKTAAYLEAGVREVWRADVRDRTIYASTPTGGFEVMHTDRLVWHPREMPTPLEISIPSIFR
jgi:Uma2 family endonuclease